MRLGDDGFYHLTYCTNIHPGETWAAVQANLETYLPGLKAQLAPDRPFGVGLRLSDAAARTGLQDGAAARLRAWLEAHGLYVFTLNGFPYGGFHRQVVKDDVYRPDWRTQERVDYTLRLVEVLAELLPDGEEGGISTSPISYKGWLDAAGREEALRQGSRGLVRVAEKLVRLRREQGTLIHIDIEPEPDCLLENTDETVAFFQEYLLPEGGRHLADRLDVSREEAEEHLLEHIRVCYDTCHFAVEYEAPGAVFDRLEEAGIRVGKVQISAALRVPLPEEKAGRAALEERLRPFAESTYLHQVVARRPDGRLGHYPDLGEALPHLAGSDAEEWRIHYHVPLFVEDYAGLRSTQPDLVAALREVQRRRLCPHLEIETYTWDVLPPDLKLELADSIRREYEWVLKEVQSSKFKIQS